jgi:hypothetical protein
MRVERRTSGLGFAAGIPAQHGRLRTGGLPQFGAQRRAFGRAQERFHFKGADHSGIVETSSFPVHLYHE